MGGGLKTMQFTRKSLRLGHFCWPQSFDEVQHDLWSNQERKFPDMINTDKLPRLYVNEDCFIDMQQFKDLAELRTFLPALQRPRQARAYLASDRLKPFRLQTFAELVADIVAADARIAA